MANNCNITFRDIINDGRAQVLGIVSIVPMGDWNATTTYQKLNYVRHNGATYLAKVANNNVEPGVAENWQNVWMLCNYDGGTVTPDGIYPNLAAGRVVNALSWGEKSYDGSSPQTITADDLGLADVYKPQGSIAYSALPATPSADNYGYVWNITDDFTTDSRFIEGAGKSYSAGTNVGVIEQNGIYYYDILGPFIDLSNYAQIDGEYPGMTVGTSESAEKVVHKLTVTVNGQATEFDGSSDESISISTDEATDPEAVRFTPQTLTSEQQAQARANIGATATEDYYTLYDQVVDTQGRFNALIASPTWLDATSVAFRGEFTATGPIVIPATVKQIDGFGLTKITVNISSDAQNAVAFGYAEMPLDDADLPKEEQPTPDSQEAGVLKKDYSVRGLYVKAVHAVTPSQLINYTLTGIANCRNLTDVTAYAEFINTSTAQSVRATGFENCNNLVNCRAGAVSYNVYNNRADGFAACNRLSNCYAQALSDSMTDTAYSYSSAFVQCRGVSNCKGQAGRCDLAEPTPTVTYTGNGRFTVYDQCRMVVNSTAETGQPADTLYYLTTEIAATTYGNYPGMTVGTSESAEKVGHKLTVTVNGQATEFDGSSDKSVTISTDEATDPEAVRFTQQTLTSEQQAQARANIGAQAAGNYYVEPSGGIPKSDLAGDVQASLDKADSALQSAPVTSVAGKTGAVTLAKGDVGLGNVDNVKQYSVNNPPPYPVTSVNGQTGAVAVGFTDFSDGIAARQDNVGYYCTFQQGAVKGLRLGDQCIIQGRVKCIDFHWATSAFLSSPLRAAAAATGRWWLDTMEDGGKVSMNRTGGSLYFARTGSSGVTYANEYISFFIMYETMDAATLAATPAILFETAEGVVLDTAENRLAYPQQALLKDAQLKASAANTETVKADVD